MSLSFPYTYISCPCSDNTSHEEDPNSFSDSKTPTNSRPASPADPEDETPFDPQHPRSNFSLFPPEHLLYCEECREIKCPRCIVEEQICYFCTSCLFETPSSAVRSEGNRCARNCFNCPICFSQLSVNSIDSSTKDGPWILTCNYCMWTTLDIGIKFDKPTNIRAQLDRVANGGTLKPSHKQAESTETSRMPSFLSRASTLPEEPPSPKPAEPSPPTPLGPAARFNALKSFYKTQLLTSSTADSSSLASLGGDFSYSSPSSLTRILNLYSSSNTLSTKKKPKLVPMREALTAEEGLSIPIPTIDPTTTTTTTTTPLSSPPLEPPSLSQLRFQIGPIGGAPSATCTSQLRPVPAPLTSKRSKRCRTCKQILVKPEAKPTSTRCRIKLVALGTIPSINLTPFPAPTSTSTTSGSASVQAAVMPNILLGNPSIFLSPGKPSQFILTLRNPLFEVVRVSLATPTTVPGRFGHRVTILCPQFEVGACSDVWDEALARKSGNGNGSGSGSGGLGEAVAGKVFDKGRNWTSVVLEIVPVAVSVPGEGIEGGEIGRIGGDEGDEGVLEVPIRVRLEWKQGELDGGVGKREKMKDGTEGEDGRRDLAYWMVLGVGRVKSTSETAGT